MSRLALWAFSLSEGYYMRFEGSGDEFEVEVSFAAFVFSRFGLFPQGVGIMFDGSVEIIPTLKPMVSPQKLLVSRRSMNSLPCENWTVFIFR